MMISVVIAPPIFGEAAREPTRARPFIGIPPAAPRMWRRLASLAEQEVEEALCRRALRRAAVEIQALGQLGKLWELRQLRQLRLRQLIEQVLELLLGLALELVWI